MPVVGNLFQSKQRVALALGIEGDVTEECMARMRRRVKPALVATGPVKEAILKGDIDILKALPVLTHHEKDAGPYFTSAVTVAKDPETGLRGMGIHRIQVKGKDRIGIFLATPPLSEFFKKAEERGQPLDIAVVVGMDPATFLASISRFQPGVDKFDVAGGLRGEPVELVKCESVDVDVPANAEFVLEGQVLPGIREYEGPFGESTGYYLGYENPVGRINLITHRVNPVYHALMPFGKEEGTITNIVFGGFSSEELKARVPKLRKFSISPILGGPIVAQIEKTSEADGRNAIEAIFGAAPHAKGVIIVDLDIDVEDPREVEWAVVTRFRSHRDLVISQVPGRLVIDPSAEEGMISKWGVDATKPFGQEERFEKIAVPAEAYARVKELLKPLLQGKGEK